MKIQLMIAEQGKHDDSLAGGGYLGVCRNHQKDGGYSTLYKAME
jgi:hypothetical protein